MKQTNSSTFTRVLALVLCLVMLAGIMTSCLAGTDNDGDTGLVPDTKPDPKPDTTPGTPSAPSNPDDGENENEEEIDPNEIFSASAQINEGALIYGALASEVTIGEEGLGAILPADVKIEAGASSLALSIKKAEAGDELVLGEGDVATALDVHISGVDSNNKVPMIVNLGSVLAAGLNATELKLYHTEGGVASLMTRVDSADDFAIHNQYTYNADTGEVSIYVASFSVFSAVQTTVDEWDETSDTTWYNENDTEFTLTTAEQLAGFRDLVDGGNTFAGKTVKLGTDIDLADKSFNPIGYGYDTVFSGTFDGAGHTIYNLYQNGWALGYSSGTQGGGLFASVKNATIKNLAINGAEIVMECVDIGTVVGYAQGTCYFENIVVTNAKLANYQRYTGGVVGEVSYGINDADGYSHTFKNIVVDSSVKISSLWGDFDNACGGVIGGKWGDATVKMENLTVACEIDAFSDVTAAYQWYAYRRCGMLIGHTEQNSPKQALNAAASFLTCENVNVYYGDWVNYTYYQFAGQDNTTGQRYPWVRAEAGEHNEAFSNPRYGVPTYGGIKVSEMDEEALANVKTGFATITFNQLYGGGQGVYGCADHEGVMVTNKLTKTVYIQNNLGWTDLKLDYWFANGNDTWTTIIDGIDMSGMLLENNIYKVEVPIYAHGFKITADGDNETDEFLVVDVANNGFYLLEGEHEHSFDSNGDCICGCKKATVVIGDYADAEGWKNETQYKSITIGNIVLTANGGGNTGKYYVNGENWRLYSSEKAQLIITSENVQIISVKITYTNIDGKVEDKWLLLNELPIASDELVEVNADSVTFDVKGKVGIETIEVVYSAAPICAHTSTTIETIDPTCTESGYTATKCIECGKIMSKVDGEAATGHLNKTIITVAATCTEAGSETETCDDCGATVRTEKIAATGHTYVNGVCSACDATESTPSFNRYYIATIRSSGNYFYMTSDLGTASTKRYQAIDSGLTTLPTSITAPEDGYVFVLIDNGDGTYSIQAGGVEGNNYLGWTSGNSGTLVAETSALKLTVDITDGVYNIHFAASDGERYLALNETSGNNYFAWYKSGQKQNLVLIPVESGEGGETPEPSCEHTNTKTTSTATCTEAGTETTICNDCGVIVSTTVISATGHTFVDGVCDCGEVKAHECESLCDTCGGCTDATCGEAVCTNKCNGHSTITTPTWTLVEDISTINSNDIIIIVWTTSNGKSYAISNDKGTSAAPTAVEVTLNGEANDNIKWNISNDGGNLTIYPNGTTATWLYCTSTNNGVRVGTNTNKTFTIDATSGYLKNTATSRYVGVYTTNPDVRCYTNTTGNIANQTLAFYVYNDGSSGGDNGGSEGGETEHTHTYVEEITTAATCGTAGLKTFTCSCGEDTYTEEIPATGEHTYENGVCTGCGAEDPNVGGTTEPTTKEETISFANTDHRESQTTSKQVWSNEDVKLTNNKASSTSNIIDSYNPVRFYANSELIVEATGMAKIVFDCNSSSYATALKNSIGTVSGATVTVSSDKVTVAFISAVDSFTIAKLTAQVRMDSITVTYTK